MTRLNTYILYLFYISGSWTFNRVYGEGHDVPVHQEAPLSPIPTSRADRGNVRDSG